MDIRYFIGIAKATLAWAVYNGKKRVLQTNTLNTVAGIKTALRLWKTLPNWKPQQAVCCMEHTGIYNAHWLDFLYKLRLPIWLDSSLQIKKAGGWQRGKTDSIDAQRIAAYAFRFRDQLRLWEPPRQVVQKLALLSAARRCGKVKEGKNKMLVLNAVGNKLIHRIYAVVERGEQYDKNYVSPLA